MPPTNPTDDIAKKVRALAKLADELEAGASFEITKLTVLKAFCAERRPRVRFAHQTPWRWLTHQKANRCPQQFPFRA